MIDLRGFQDFRGCTQYDKVEAVEAKQERVASCQDAQKGSKTSTTFDSWAFILPGSLSTHALGNIGIQLLSKNDPFALACVKTSSRVCNV